MKVSPKTVLRVLLFSATIYSLFLVPWPILTAWIKPLPNTIEEQMGKVHQYGFDGIVVYADIPGGSPQLYAAGYKSRENKTPADPTSLFKIASVSKLYYALAATKMVHQKTLCLNTTLSEFLPELKDRIQYADQITLEMLINHRSGIPDYTSVPNYWAAPKETAKETLELVLDKPARFEPGKDYEYSNTNYLLLKLIMNRRLGYDSFHYIKDHILRPLNLNQTFGSLKDVNLDDVMSGYYVGYDQDLKTDNVSSVIATAEDVGKFIRALNNGKAFSNKGEEQLYHSLYKTSHTGLIPGYQTIAEYHPEMDAVVIQFTNTVNFDGYNWNMSEVMYNRIVKILKKNS